MSSCCSRGTCIHCRRDLRWFVAGLSALALVSLSDNIDTDRTVARQDGLGGAISLHLAGVADWISGQPSGPRR